MEAVSFRMTLPSCIGYMGSLNDENDVNRVLRSSLSPDLNPSEHLWEILDPSVRQCSPSPSTKQGTYKLWTKPSPRHDILGFPLICHLSGCKTFHCFFLDCTKVKKKKTVTEHLIDHKYFLVKSISCVVDRWKWRAGVFAFFMDDRN